MNAHYWIENLQLLPHPEGGYYKETYRSKERVEAKGFDGERNISTAIYFLLEGNNISHLHRIKSDELWFFHDGNILEIIILDDKGMQNILLGKDLQKGERLQAIVPAGSWFGARVKDEQGYVLVSCTVAPGFDFKDFVLGEKSKLLEEYPNNADIINVMSIS